MRTTPSMHPALSHGLDATEILLATRPLAEVLRLLTRADLPTIPPPRNKGL